MVSRGSSLTHSSFDNRGIARIVFYVFGEITVADRRPPLERRGGRDDAYLVALATISSSSTSKINVAPGLMTGGDPRSP
jgi:hypothetical protein